MRVLREKAQFPDFLLNENILVSEEEQAQYASGKDFVTLRAWQKCRELKNFLYSHIIPALPKEENYALGSQIRRAAVSTTANIAEGYGRFHYKEGIQFYRISRGSIYELKDHVITCYDQKYIDSSILKKALSLIEEAKSTLNGFIHFVQKQVKKE